MRGPWYRATARCRCDLFQRKRESFDIRFGQVRVLSYLCDGNAASHPNWAVGDASCEKAGSCGLNAGGKMCSRKCHAKTHSVPGATATSSPQTTQCIHNDTWSHNRDALASQTDTPHPHPLHYPHRLVTAVPNLCSFSPQTVRIPRSVDTQFPPMDRPVARQTAHGSHGKVIARPEGRHNHLKSQTDTGDLHREPIGVAARYRGPADRCGCTSS
jgi:hypothetical protein